MPNIRKLYKQGHSLVSTWPRHITDNLGLKDQDEIQITILSDHAALVTNPAKVGYVHSDTIQQLRPIAEAMRIRANPPPDTE